MNIEKHLRDGVFWFRINGYGLMATNRDMNPPLFSVRNGLTKELRMLKYGIQLLTPS